MITAGFYFQAADTAIHVSDVPCVVIIITYIVFETMNVLETANIVPVVVDGTGNGQMLGILNDPRVLATGNVVEMTAAEINDWTVWRKKFFAKLPLGYRSGEFIFPLGTVDAYLETMTDANGNPVFRQATGLEVTQYQDYGWDPVEL